jgi:NAD(P) transhydrogenase subunit beta
MTGSLASLRTLAYIVSSLLFILSLRGLSHQETARRGNLLGALGMALAVVMTGLVLVFPSEKMSSPAPMTTGLSILGAAIAVGAIIGAALAARVAMTSMPELVAVLHSFVGAAAVLCGIASYLSPHQIEGSLVAIHDVEVYLGVFIGAVTFTGSIIAFLKLRALIGGQPLLLPGRHFINLALVIGSAVLMRNFMVAPTPQDGLMPLLIMTALASVLGIHLVVAIGGGDMPVVVSMLNSYSGWAAAAAGFMLSNDLLIITGALVGSSGAILSYIMCKAMNRSIWNVIFGGFGQVAPTSAGKKGEQKPVQETSAEQTAQLLLASKNVIIVPGYGMAVAQAQHAVWEVTQLLQEKGVNVRYAIHPVAGRLPGHMNVLLAEANVPYDIVKEMDEINAEFPETDVAVIIGANDIVNPGALTDPQSPIYGMPVLEAWKAGKVVMLKRSMSAGYAGVDNEICYRENTLMLFGDAKKSVQKIAECLRGA